MWTHADNHLPSVCPLCHSTLTRRSDPQRSSQFRSYRLNLGLPPIATGMHVHVSHQAGQAQNVHRLLAVVDDASTSVCPYGRNLLWLGEGGVGETAAIKTHCEVRCYLAARSQVVSAEGGSSC